GLPLPEAHAHPLGKPPAWIWASTVGNHQSVYLYKTLTLKSLPVKPVVYVTADNYFTLYINGQKVTAHLSNVLGWSHARRINISRYLRIGSNEFAIKATNDGGPAGAILWLISGGKTLLKTDGSWRVSQRPGKNWPGNPTGKQWLPATVEAVYGTGPWARAVHPWPGHSSYLFHLYFQPQRVTVIRGAAAFSGLHTVARMLTKEDAATLRPGYRGSSKLAPARRIRLLIHPSNPPQLLPTKSVINQPILVVPAGNKSPELLLSFGQEVAGRIQVRGSGGTVIIGTGESRGEALHCPWGGVHPLPMQAGQTESTPYSAFRYATVQFLGHGPIKLNRLRLDFKYYPVKYRGAFACSDPLLTKIWYTGAYTAHLCMQEQIWDGPKRDRGLWMGDLQITGQTINNVFLDHFLMELSMTQVRLQSQGGRPADALPISYINTLPGYSNAWICGLADFYRHTGALKYIQSQHQLLLSMLRYMKLGFNKKNLFVNKLKANWNFVDWAPKLVAAPDTPQANMATDLYTCWGVRRAVFLLKAMGDSANAAKYARWDQQLIAAARKYLANPKTHTFTNIRQVNAMAIDSHVADARQRRAIYARILGPNCPSWKQVATPYYNNFVIFALSHLGHYRQALNFIRYYWGGMIHEGATTFWEKYDPTWPKKHFHRYLDNNGKPDPNLAWNYLISLCHGWSSGVTNWLTDYTLGVQPVSGGFSRVVIAPHLCGLTWVSGRVPTPHGAIVVKVKKTSGREILTITLPNAVHATIVIPGNSVTINGKAVRVIRS
ncbi:MAG: alpha-L-rhamnosidase C-terminal domain-containing protein, partial [Phycisphaerae bacterium]